MRKLLNKYPYLFVALLGALVYLPFLGQSHLFDWDEINFAESAREVLVSGNYSTVQVNFLPFWEKPPLFIWMQAVAMKAFGINEFAARIPNAICGIITLLVLFYYGRKYFGARFGWLWVLLYMGSLLPHFYFKSGIIDPWFNLFMLLGIFQLATLTQGTNKRWSHVWLAGAFLGLAILTKGPVGLLIPMLSLLVFFIVRRNFRLVGVLEMFGILVVAALVSSPWYGVETAKTGWWFMEEFIDYHIRLLQTEDAGHGGPFYYHFVVVLLGCFPASFLALASFRFSYMKTTEQRLLKHWMLIVLGVVLVVFSIVDTKIVHYSSMTYFPVTFLAALFLRKVSTGTIAAKVALKWAIGVFLVVLAGILLFVPVVGNNTEMLVPYIKDPFAVGNLSADVSWPWYTYLPGAVLALMAIIWLPYASKSFYSATTAMLVVMLITIEGIMLLFVPRIEGYSQRAAIEFFQEHANEEAYINVLGYKSYAYYFYGNKKPQDIHNPVLNKLIEAAKLSGSLNSNPTSKELFEFERQWHLTGPVNKPVYFVVKVNKAQPYRDMKQLQEIGSKNGFVFFKREPVSY